MDNRLVDVKAVVELLGVKEKTLYSWVNQRKIPYVKVGRLLRFDLSKVEEWIKENSVAVYDDY
jgi:excisionase family DNA binding protein